MLDGDRRSLQNRCAARRPSTDPHGFYRVSDPVASWLCSITAKNALIGCAAQFVLDASTGALARTHSAAVNDTQPLVTLRRVSVNVGLSPAATDVDPRESRVERCTREHVAAHRSGRGVGVQSLLPKNMRIG